MYYHRCNMARTVYTLMAVAAFIAAVHTQDYCNTKSCKDYKKGPHTMCKYSVSKIVFFFKCFSKKKKSYNYVCINIFCSLPRQPLHAVNTRPRVCNKRRKMKLWPFTTVFAQKLPVVTKKEVIQDLNLPVKSEKLPGTTSSRKLHKDGLISVISIMMHAGIFVSN